MKKPKIVASINKQIDDITNRPHYYFYTTSNNHDIDPIDHGNILQPEVVQDRDAALERREQIKRMIGIFAFVAFGILATVLSFTLK